MAVIRKPDKRDFFARKISIRHFFVKIVFHFDGVARWFNIVGKIDHFPVDKDHGIDKFESEVRSAERLVWLLKDMGQPVHEQMAQVKTMKNELKKMKQGIVNDEKYYNDDSTLKE